MLRRIDLAFVSSKPGLQRTNAPEDVVVARWRNRPDISDDIAFANVVFKNFRDHGESPHHRVCSGCHKSLLDDKTVTVSRVTGNSSGLKNTSAILWKQSQHFFDQALGFHRFGKHGTDARA